MGWVCCIPTLNLVGASGDGRGDMSDSTTMNCGPVITLPESVQVQRVLTVIAVWKVERDAKCEYCKGGLDLGAHGCHFDNAEIDGEEESYSVGNCKAWRLSRMIKQLEEAMRP
jgi:hypothetical protein